MTVIYQDGKDMRYYVLGGFIERRSGNYTLVVNPPIRGLDLIGRNHSR